MMPVLADAADTASRLMAETFVRVWYSCSSRINGWQSGRWPPRAIPQDLLSEYTMGGEIPVISWYINDVRSGGLKWTPRSLWWWPERVRRRQNGYYGKTDSDLYNAFDRHSIRGKELVILGSESPWYECIAVQYGASVTTIEYRKVVCSIPGLKVQTPADFSKEPRQFDMALSISSIEHDGLGRYGDPLNPNGDLQSLSNMKRLLRPGGLLFLAVPVGLDALAWNAHRIYGRKRLPLLLDGWRTVATYGFEEKMLDEGPLGRFDRQPTFVLTPE